MKLQLKKDDIKPSFDLLGLEALLDTGAEISVCTLSQAVFEQIFMNNPSFNRLGFQTVKIGVH